MSTALAATVDLTRYPIDDLNEPAGAALVEYCRSELEANGACDLPGFVSDATVDRILGEAVSLRRVAFRTDTTHNIEFSGREDELDADDPLRIQVRSAKWLVAYDQIPDPSPLRDLYESDELLRFLSAALDVEPLYRHADPIGALNVMFYDEADELGWHFDNADFAVTLMLQKPSGGGAFEYVPMLRAPDDANPVGVAKLLTGDREGIRTLDPDPGTLALFRGHLSPHRVTPTEGDGPRINAVLAYAKQPNVVLTPSARRIFFGRPDEEPT